MKEPMTSNASTLVTDLANRFSEPEWLRSSREAAWEQYSEMASPRLEKTDLTKRLWNVGPFPAAIAADANEHVQAIVDAAGDAPLVYVKDGIVLKVQLPETLKQQGVVFTDLHSAVANHGDLVQKYLGSVVTASESKWAALNTALWHGGIFLYVPRNLNIDEPFQFVYSESVEGNGAIPRVLIVGDEGSEFSVTEVYLSQGERGQGQVHSAVAEVVAKVNSQIKVVSVSTLSKGPTNYVLRRAELEKDAVVDWIFGDVGDGFTIALIESRLKGTGSRSTAKVLGLGYGRQRMDLTTSMVHYGRYSESDMNLHGVLKERANSLYRTSTHIADGAIAAGSEQHDRMLLLDTTARADAIPMLLIDENDVQRCGHAASVGKIDQNQIYYLMSRGIPEALATRMIVWGYLEPTVAEIPVEAVRQVVTTLIDRELDR